jgi:AraC-like DNA-binding protein
MHFVTNERVGLAELSDTIAGKLTNAAHRRWPIVVIQQVLLDALDCNLGHGNGDVMRAVALIRQSVGCRPITDISRSVGLSPRQLQRRFNDEVGVSTKAYARIVRFDGLVRALRSGLACSWAQIAQGFGYHDQAHLIREFRAFAGQSPTEFAASQHLMTDHFTSSAGLSDFYNTSMFG